jgi:hypothetical protein
VIANSSQKSVIFVGAKNLGNEWDSQEFSFDDKIKESKFAKRTG